MTANLSQSRIRHAIAGAFGVLLGCAMLGSPVHAQLTNLGNEPLNIFNLAPPNVLLTIDNSGMLNTGRATARAYRCDRK